MKKKRIIRKRKNKKIICKYTNINKRGQEFPLHAQPASPILFNRPSSTQFGQVLDRFIPCLDCIRPVQTSLDQVKPVWTSLDQFNSTQPCLNNTT